MAAPKEIDNTEEAALASFLLRLCHDLRAPLRAIRTHSELLVKDWPGRLDAPVDQRLGFITAGTESIERLVDGLTGYSLALSIDRGSFQPVKMDVLLRLALAKLQKEFRDSGATVTYDSLPRVHGNPDSLAQLWEILLLNSARHRGPETPCVHVSAERRGSDWILGVQDNGPGIEAAYLERVFNPFERLRGKETAGAGLGLAIARVIVGRHGGKIWAEPQAGAGARVSFSLPAVD